MDLTQKIELIERDKNTSLYDKTELILVLAGEKPAMTLHIADTDMDAYNGRRMREVASLFTELEMPYKIGDKLDHPMFIGFVYVGKDQKHFDNIDNASTHEEYGICYGFPDTSIEACINKSKRFNGSEKERVEQMDLDIPYEKLKPFLQFTFSDEHFEEEVLSTSLRWHDTIKRLTPNIYSQIDPKTSNTLVPYNPTPKELFLDDPFVFFYRPINSFCYISYFFIKETQRFIKNNS